jgi:DNA-binding transcriptional ArsR family regulator
MKRVQTIDDPRYVKAMSHPSRVRILAMLDERKASPNPLAGWLGASLGTVAYHVRTLEQLGLIELVDETRVPGAVEHHYRAPASSGAAPRGHQCGARATGRVMRPVDARTRSGGLPTRQVLPVGLPQGPIGNRSATGWHCLASPAGP